MAHPNLLFDSLTGSVDVHTLGTVVQSLLESQCTADLLLQPQHHVQQQQQQQQQQQLASDEGDVFLCGTCKKQFLSMAAFCTHKQNCAVTVAATSTSMDKASPVSLAQPSLSSLGSAAAGVNVGGGERGGGGDGTPSAGGTGGAPESRSYGNPGSSRPPPQQHQPQQHQQQLQQQQQQLQQQQQQLQQQQQQLQQHLQTGGVNTLLLPDELLSMALDPTSALHQLISGSLSSSLMAQQVSQQTTTISSAIGLQQQQQPRTSAAGGGLAVTPSPAIGAFHGLTGGHLPLSSLAMLPVGSSSSSGSGQGPASSSSSAAGAMLAQGGHLLFGRAGTQQLIVSFGDDSALLQAPASAVLTATSAQQQQQQQQREIGRSSFVQVPVPQFGGSGGMRGTASERLSAAAGSGAAVAVNEQTAGTAAAPVAAKQLSKCQYCDKTFNKRYDLVQHLRAHTGEKPFHCEVCGRAFAQKSNVRKHMQTHKVWPSKVICTLPQPTPEPAGAAGGVFQPSASYATSAAAALLEAAVAVGSADQKSTARAADSAAAAAAAPGGGAGGIGSTAGSSSTGRPVMPVVDSSYVCPFCSTRHATYYKLRSHMKTHKSEQVYKCILKTCSATFKTSEEFLSHTATHRDVLSYRCHVCGKHYASSDDLRMHEHSHQMAAAVAATVAAAAAPSSGRLGEQSQAVDCQLSTSGGCDAASSIAVGITIDSHSAAIGKTVKRQCSFKCTKCNNKYSSPEALQQHVTTTSHEHPCVHCSRVFPCERYLRRHLQCHSVSARHECMFCRKLFKTEHYLKLHTLIHTGQKPYQCDTCGKAFNRKDKVRRHALTHEPIKRYRCPYAAHTGCNKAFNRPDKLKAHVAKHSSSNNLLAAAALSTVGGAMVSASGQGGGDGCTGQFDVAVAKPRGRCQCQLSPAELERHICPAVSSADAAILCGPSGVIAAARAASVAGKLPRRRASGARGRPRKSSLISVTRQDACALPKRRPGRPRKAAEVAEAAGAAAAALGTALSATEGTVNIAVQPTEPSSSEFGQPSAAEAVVATTASLASTDERDSRVAPVVEASL